MFAISQYVTYESETICTSGGKTIGLDSNIHDSLHPLNRNRKLQEGEIYFKVINSLIKAKS